MKSSFVFDFLLSKAMLFVLFFFVFTACKTKPAEPPIFKVLGSSATGINFTNKLSPTDSFNVFHYMYYYNGAGVAVGDFNNDGLMDIFFAANQSDNKIYLNEGKLHFKDVTAETKIPQDGGWSTGVSVVDINNDGLLDIYLCRVGKYEILNSHNELLVCKGIDKNGVPFYEDEAKKYGLNFSGFCTQAAFFDYDGDGDLDMYLLNHSIHQNGTYGPRNMLLSMKNPFSGDHIFRNDNGFFTDVTASSGIHSSVIGYGLGITIADINLDGWPDIYVGNDFHENDYLYMNQHNGTFKDMRDSMIMHSSQYSMGTDIADITNDGEPEIMSVDMLSNDPYILKRSLGIDEYDTRRIKMSYGFDEQESHNNLQLNLGNGHFSETSFYSGVAATDWSWAPLIFDFDNDGRKDIFISNGIPKRLNDIDYINYVSNDEVQVKIRMNNLGGKDMGLIDKFPQIKIPNKFFMNKGHMSFTDMQDAISGNDGTYSNGCAYADLDNDGDLDIVVNNIDEASFIYENVSNDKKDKPFFEIKLKGDSNNINAVGAKIIAFAGDSIRTYEKFPVHGFLSSMEIPIHVGTGKTAFDSVLLVWPDNSYEKIEWQKDTSKITTLTYQKGLPQFDYSIFQKHQQSSLKPVEDIASKVGLHFKHDENEFIEFDREPLIPHTNSQEGPALAVADINNDGLDDVFIGASKRIKASVFLQDKSGRFQKIDEPDLYKDSMYEDIDACWVDVNNDHHKDLVIASGGNEYYNNDVHMLPRVYLNNGNGNLVKVSEAFKNIYVTASTVSSCDFNGDGFEDIFIGGRVVPWHYGEIPHSYLLQNDGTGHFVDVTSKYAKELSNVGMVTRGIWFDIDKDGDSDLILSLEWDGIIAFINNHGNFTKKYLTDKKGWWNFIVPCDVDGDGDADLIAGNLGLNSRLKASSQQPVQLYYNDFDDNGTKEPVLTFYLGNKQIPFSTYDELQKKIPLIKKNFLYAGDFAKASLQDIFSKDKLNSAQVLSADYFPNSILINNGNLNFTVRPMPWRAQLSTYRDAVITDANGDNLPDILLMGNNYDNNIQLGPYDADYGTILINHGHAQFTAEKINGLAIKGQVRHIQQINIAGKKDYILARNNDTTMVLSYK